MCLSSDSLESEPETGDSCSRDTFIEAMLSGEENKRKPDRQGKLLQE